MSESDIAVILRAIDELKQEVVALKAWQTVREDAENAHRIRADERKRWLKFALIAGRSPVVPWLCAGVGVAWATFR